MTADPGTDVVPYTRPEPPMIGLTGLVRRVTDLGLGAASLAGNAAVDALERFVPADPEGHDGVPAPGVLRHLPGALVGAGLAAQRRLLEATDVAERGLARVTSTVARTPVVGAPMRATESYLAEWSDRAEVEQARNRALLGEFVRRLAPEVATAVVQQLDVGTLVDQLPIDSIIAQVDIDSLLDHLDIDAIVSRVDIGALLERIDVQAIIDRVDIDAIVGRVDLDGLMKRIDIGPLAAGVLDEVDIGAIVRESTGSITGDVVDGGRVTAMRLDGFLARTSDRVLFRRRPRRLDGPELQDADLLDAGLHEPGGEPGPEPGAGAGEAPPQPESAPTGAPAPAPGEEDA
jgi:hypothetical protein